MGEWRYKSTIFDLVSTMEVSGQFHAHANLAPGKSPPGTQWIGGWVRLSRSGRCGGEKNNLALPGIELRSSSPSLYRLSYPDSMPVYIYIYIWTSQMCVCLFRWSCFCLTSRRKRESLLERQSQGNCVFTVSFMVLTPSICFPILCCEGKTSGPSQKRVCFHSIRGDEWPS
jgi:hypothetical protein